MVEGIVFYHSFDDLEKALRLSAKRQAVISQNIANANTPGYKAMDFDEALDRAVERQGEKKVVMEKEMVALADNSVRYSAYLKMISNKLGILKTIASQGRR